MNSSDEIAWTLVFRPMTALGGYSMPDSAPPSGGMYPNPSRRAELSVGIEGAGRPVGTAPTVARSTPLGRALPIHRRIGVVSASAPPSRTASTGRKNQSRGGAPSFRAAVGGEFALSGALRNRSVNSWSGFKSAKGNRSAKGRPIFDHHSRHRALTARVDAGSDAGRTNEGSK